MSSRKVIIVGLGYMGSIIKTNMETYYPEFEVLGVDPKHSGYNQFSSLGEVFKKVNPNDVYCAFVATPARSHFEVVRNLANIGIKNIYCEKPMVITPKQAQEIVNLKRKHSLKLAVGYILRHKKLTEYVKSLERSLVDGGYELKHIEVKYQKFKAFNDRRESDLGIFEELYHAVDWISYISMNYSSKIVINGCNLVEDIDFPSKFAEGKIIGTIIGQDYNTSFNIFSSFRQKDKTRLFKLYYANSSMDVRTICVRFDDGNDNDTVSLISSSGNENKLVSFRSKDKLISYIEQVFDWYDNDNLDQTISTPTQNLQLEMLMLDLTRKNNDKKHIVEGYAKQHNINFKTPLSLSSGREITFVSERRLTLKTNMDGRIYEGFGNSIDSYKWAHLGGDYEVDDNYIRLCTKDVLLGIAGIKVADIVNLELCIGILSKLQTLKFIEERGYKIPETLTNMLITPFTVAILSAAEKFYRRNILSLYFAGLLSDKVDTCLKTLYPREMLGLDMRRFGRSFSERVTYVYTLSNIKNLEKNGEKITSLGVKVLKLKVNSEDLDATLELIRAATNYFPTAKFI